ncbi:CGNR zinc finger domain-containing protein [Streptomyces sp. TRM66268-LWL]|uniref:CGNR zinc finger domain-containing protein n=1 Tax=Streptomyces polyasparticus TaxID=2767826 RepID=A0ABR7SER7_9ACTN|nr:CGNR zinc finger domain-containing protein [Streptomyces polyasparticus]MBC9713991.1 CGNR zinc finger domain-containing protein [Streptomyces polyasparticus]
MDERAPLTGEPLALDLVNTRPATPDGDRADLIGTPPQLADWLAAQADRLPAEVHERVPTAADVTALHAVRADVDAVLGALLHGTRPPAEALRGLSEAQAAAPRINELAFHDGQLRAIARRIGTPAAALAAVFAEDAVEVLSGPGAAKIKRCEAEDCVLLFLPAHPRRRWCSPTRCGNRTRVARYYQRHKPAAQDGRLSG